MLPKKLQSISKAQDGNIVVGCRFRPLNDSEKNRSGDLNVDFPSDEKTVVLNQQFEGFGQQRFTYDFVFPPGSEQKVVYECTALPIVEGVMQGFNGTVFAYGQTSSGKTFTMAGPDIYDESLKGIIPRMVSTVFDKISSADESSEFLVRIGFCEIYLEKIKDLIDPARKDLKVLEDKARGVYIAGLSEHYVNSGDELLRFMDLGQANREVAFTLMNAGSSRSHSIFITTINQKNTRDFSEKTGKLFLVDLAGSEKVGKTGATGKTLEEAKNINKSLTCLGKVINSLTDGTSTHIPYRDSKLTRVLQDSLGGNSKTALIITCSPSPYNESETMSTLRFGIRAKAIKNKPKVNKEFTVAELKLLIAKLEEQILKKDKYIEIIEETLKKSGLGVPNVAEYEQKNEEEESEMMKELKEVRENLTTEYEKNEGLQAENLNLTNTNESLLETIKNLESKIEEIENNLEENKEILEKTIELNSTLEEEVKSFYTEKINFEKKISELSFDLEKMNNMKSVPHAPVPVIANLKQIEKELEKYKEFEKKIFVAEDILKAKLVSADDIAGLREIIISNLIQEKNSIDDSIFTAFLEDYYKEIERLEIQVITYEKKYLETMAMLSGDHRKVKDDLEKQHYQVENLTLLYNKLLNEKAGFKVDQQLSKRKIDKLIEMNKEQNQTISSLNEKLEDLTSELSAKALEVVENSKNEEAPAPVTYSNVRKPIKGGQSFLAKMAMADNKNVKFLSELIKAQTNP